MVVGHKQFNLIYVQSFSKKEKKRKEGKKERWKKNNFKTAGDTDSKHSLIKSLLLSSE